MTITTVTWHNMQEKDKSNFLKQPYGMIKRHNIPSNAHMNATKTMVCF